MSILGKYYTPDVLGDDYKLSSSGTYFAPPAGDVNSYIEFIKALPSVRIHPAPLTVPLISGRRRPRRCLACTRTRTSLYSYRPAPLPSCPPYRLAPLTVPSPLLSPLSSAGGGPGGVWHAPEREHHLPAAADEQAAGDHLVYSAARGHGGGRRAHQRRHRQRHRRGHPHQAAHTIQQGASRCAN
eukprot:420823-Prorocentrum_minimum.AAC.1